MSQRFGHLAQRIFNRPVAIHPEKAEIIVGALAERLGLATMIWPDRRQAGGTKAGIGWDYDDEGSSGQHDQGYDLIQGVAVIPIEGTLVQKTSSLRPWSGMTGYNGIRQAFLAALEDPVVDAIALNIDSPGGEVAGCFDLVDLIYRARGEKPIWAILDEVAYSAAYAIASAADCITVPRTGGTGSIGVVCLHVDWSRALDKAGITPTFIHYGARKVDGAAEQPLSSAALARFQADIDLMGDLFCETVARNRAIVATKIKAMEAGTFLGSLGVEVGLADAVMAPDAAFLALLSKIVQH